MVEKMNDFVRRGDVRAALDRIALNTPKTKLSILAKAESALLDVKKAEVVPLVHGSNLCLPSYVSLFECSICGWECSDTCGGDTMIWNYCPNCGAKMDGGTSDGES